MSDPFTKRERHLMDVLYRHGRATAREVMLRMEGRQACSTVRTQLRVLEKKGTSGTRPWAACTCTRPSSLPTQPSELRCSVSSTRIFVDQRQTP